MHWLQGTDNSLLQYLVQKARSLLGPLSIQTKHLPYDQRLLSDGEGGDTKERERESRILSRDEVFNYEFMGAAQKVSTWEEVPSASKVFSRI